MRDVAPLTARNTKIQQLRRLAGRRSARAEAGLFVVEGPTLVAEALAAGVDIEAAFVDADARDHPKFGELAHLIQVRGVHLFDVAPGVLERVGSTVTPQPMMAVAHRCDRRLDELLSLAAGRLVLVLADVADPGNAGTLLRSAEASGTGGVIFAGETVEAFNPKVVRSSAGSLFRAPLAVDVSIESALNSLAAAGYTTVGTVARDGLSYDELDLRQGIAVVLGNEAHGLPRDVAVETLITIPVEGGAESLNVAMAGTVLCFEAARQRRVGRPHADAD